MNTIINSNYIKRAINLFIILTILLAFTTIIDFFFHPTEEVIKRLGNKASNSVSETDELIKRMGVYTNNINTNI
ncbi:hypothetical protein K2V56_11065 [Staphylococcus chromogenes]|uniref:hypothetical protein n=1 Tax=Staphylococcus chromogenes TaxID=46126 RepID=UPI001E6045A2|nr:hypothetical protein [Staphylococcus chromogenes]MCD8906015.1 hypothetical protein [Staphylococcus chromogenes]